MPDIKYPESLRERNRFDNIAQTLVQIALAVLPIAAGASGFLAQDHASFELFIAIGFVWVGMLLMSASIFLNLHVLRLSDPTNQAGWRSLRRKYNSAISVFIIGILFLVAAPIGLMVPSLKPSSPEILIHFEPKSITVHMVDKTSSSQSIVLVVENRGELSQEFQVSFSASPVHCLILTPSNLTETLAGRANKLVEVTITVNPGCVNQYYIVLGEASQHGKILNSGLLSINVKQ